MGDTRFIPTLDPIILYFYIIGSREDNLSIVRQQMTYFPIVIDVMPFMPKSWRIERQCPTPDVPDFRAAKWAR